MATKPGAATSVPVLIQLTDAQADDKLTALQAVLFDRNGGVAAKTTLKVSGKGTVLQAEGVLNAAPQQLQSGRLVIAPVVVRNLIVFYPEVAPTGLGVGWNLWAGIGETERGAEFGAPCCDEQMIEQDRRALGLAADAQIGLFWPDGIRRHRAGVPDRMGFDY